MATANVEKVSQFGKAVSLCGEAQNIYDFQAYAQASADDSLRTPCRQTVLSAHVD